MLSIFTENKSLIIPLSLSFCCILYADISYPFMIGAGGYVYSYPCNLDPYDLTEHAPRFAPQFDISAPFIKKTSLLLCFAHHKINGSLYGLVDMPQYLLLNISGLGCDYNFGDDQNQLRLGIQILGGFSQYGSANISDKSIGIGSGLYLRISRPIAKPCAWGVNMSIWGIRSKPVVDRSPLTLLSFTTGLVFYVLL